jgi:hypothetical protein
MGLLFDVYAPFLAQIFKYFFVFSRFHMPCQKHLGGTTKESSV